MKNLFLPGTNKNVGYILGNTMHIYDRCIKYFPVDTKMHLQNYRLVVGKKFIVIKDGIVVELASCKGWYHEINEKMYTFFDCDFKIPDNLDVIEMVYLYKNWNARKKNGRKIQKNS